MLAHSPPLPLIIDYIYDHLRGKYSMFSPEDVTAEDEEGVTLALQHRNRVRRIRLWMPDMILERLVAIDGEFPVLEYLYIQLRGDHQIMSSLVFTLETFQAPRLRHLILLYGAIPIGPRLQTTYVGLVTLALNTSAYFSPNNLLQRLSPMLHLETLHISLESPIVNSEIKRQLLLTPITTTVTLPNLRWFRFGGPNAYLEALLLHITSPLLEKFQILSLNPRTFRVSYLLQFMNAAGDLGFGSVKFRFHDDMVDMWADPRKGARKCSFYMGLRSSPIQQQLLDTAQIIRELRAVFPVVEHLTLENGCYVRSSAGPTEWRDFFRSFGGVKTLVVSYGFIEDISRSFRLDKGESPTEFLPELKELSYFAISPDAGDGFIAFACARQKAGRPITLSRKF
jgi:hypothetical protein